MKKQLLYLEDDAPLASMTMKALVRQGFHVLHYDSIAAFKARPALADTSHALLDMRLDDGHSMGLIPELLSHHPRIKIVLLTGYASIATAVHAIKLGAYNYLPKPASIDEILAAFNETPTLAGDINASMSLRRLEWEKIQQALSANQGNITLTAQQLNMHRRTLQRKLQKRPVLT